MYSFGNQINISGVIGGSVRVYNSIGQEVKVANLSSGNNQIAINTPGIYVVVVTSSEGSSSEKVVIN
ncbi:MAG: T9SS type A sorting domain-containing protein [Flavobacteriales bacterium]|nr:T9SS type A sorting domain-containing protein [Flavobacteriales bacterium]